MLFCVSRCWCVLHYCQTFCTVSVPGIQSLVLLGHMGTRVVAYDSRRCCGRKRVVASDVYPVSLPAAGDATEFAVWSGEFSNAYARACACRRMPGRSCRCPAPFVWLCMSPHTRRNGSPKAMTLVPICRKRRIDDAAWCVASDAVDHAVAGCGLWFRRRTDCCVAADEGSSTKSLKQ